MSKSIAELVENLPEIYQNIYGHKEYDGSSSRNCEQREQVIVDIIKKYQAYSGKKELKVLDLGCAQGFYSFALANEGCVVDGIDFQDVNIEVCNALQEENGLPCTFYAKNISIEMVQQLEDNQYDVILFFSVVHHICNLNGFVYARELFETLTQKCVFMLTELALKEEGYYWSENLPVSYDEWFMNIPFFDEQAFFGTHLTEYKRPLIFCSNQYCYLDGEYYEINEYKIKAYDDRPKDLQRRYFICNDNSVLLKCFRRPVKEAVEELENEIEFLKQNQDLNFVPRMIACKNEDGRIIEVTGIQYGRLLRDIINSDETIDYTHIFLDILDNCVTLESRGYFHGDLRSWNVVVGEEGTARLIDFGNIKKDPNDSVMELFCREKSRELQVYDAFIAMLYDALTGNNYDTIRDYGAYIPSIYYDLDAISDNYENFICQYLLLSSNELTFSKIRGIYVSTIIENKETVFSEDEQIQILSRQINRLKLQSGKGIDAWIFRALNERNLKELEGLRNENEELHQQAEDLKRQTEELKAQTEELKAQTEELKAQTEGLCAKSVDMQERMNNIEQSVAVRAYRKVKKVLIKDSNR